VERVVTESGEVSARYEYGPFGEEITRRGVGAQPFRFSTKYHDEETGLLYYGYRYYNPRWGRWLSKDPIGERGGVNLYGMVGNDPLNYVDCLGLERRACPCDTKAVNQKAREFTDKAVQMTKDDEKNLPKNAIKPPSTGREFGGRICCNKKTGDVSGTGPIPGTWKTLAGPIWVGEEVDPKKAPACTTLGSDWEDAGFYHTHPSGSTGFSGSGGDVTWMWSNGGYPNFLGRMTGDPLRMDPKMTLYTDQYGTNPIKWGEVNSIGPDGSETPVSFPPRLTP
jgi:RHS repeat-associated protein